MSVGAKNWVFDLYGTVVDVRTDEADRAFRQKFVRKTAELWGQTDFWQEYDRRIAAELERLQAVDGEVDVRGVIASIAEDSGHALTDKQIDRVALCLRRLSRHRLRVYPAIRQRLRQLRKTGHGVWLVSNAQACFTRPELRKLRLVRCWDGVVLSGEVGYKKPSGQIFAAFAEKYGVDLTDCVYVGNDLYCDIEGAKAVGMRTVYVHSAISPAEDTLSNAYALADVVAADHRQLAAVMKRTMAEER